MNPQSPRQWFFNAKGEATKQRTDTTVFTCWAVTFKQAKEKFNAR